MIRLGKLPRARRVLGPAAVALMLALASHAAAGPLVPGVALFDTVAGPDSYYDFGANPLPANTLFQGSGAFTGKVLLEGVPFAPALFGSKDTVISLSPPAGQPIGNSATVQTDLAALTLKSIAPLAIPSGGSAAPSLYNLYVTLDPSVANRGQGQITFTRLA